MVAIVGPHQRPVEHTRPTVRRHSSTASARPGGGGVAVSSQLCPLCRLVSDTLTRPSVSYTGYFICRRSPKAPMAMPLKSVFF